MSVPALVPVTAHALVPSVAASVSVPPPPAMVPLKVGTAAARVKVSLRAPPTRASMLVAFKPSTLAALAPVILQAVALFRPVSVSAPVPPVRLVMALKVVLVLSVPAFVPVMTHALVPSTAANVSVPPPPAMLPLKTTPEACVKVSLTDPPTNALMLVPLMPSAVTALAPVKLKVVSTLRPASVSAPVPPVRLVMALNAVLVLSVPALVPVTAHALVPSVATSVSMPPPPAMEPLKVCTPAASVKVSAAVPPCNAPKPVKPTVPMLPALSPVMAQALTVLAPTRVWATAPVRVSTLTTLVPSVTELVPVAAA